MIGGGEVAKLVKRDTDSRIYSINLLYYTLPKLPSDQSRYDSTFLALSLVPICLRVKK